nr:uncharacterized protein LOC129488070 isoform X1 [Symphalangus syndactylus]XP_055145765.1 uncharacterized protein LOC129488070 isoform X1 [Symphalangus syndactylus]
MGLTIKGQCIPDVAEPMGCVQRAEGFSERGARAVRRQRWCRAGSGAEAQREAEGDARPRQGLRPPRPGGSKLALGYLNAPTPRETSGARSHPPCGDGTCLKAVSLADAWLGRRMDAAGMCPGSGKTGRNFLVVRRWTSVSAAEETTTNRLWAGKAGGRGWGGGGGQL